MRKPLLIYFTENDREALKKALLNHAQFSASDLVRWLVVEYAEGRLRPPTVEMNVADFHAKFGREFMLDEKISGIALEMARLKDEIVKRLDGLKRGKL